MSQESEERKLVIDEDWKEQVEREREEARLRDEGGDSAATSQPTGAAGADDDFGGDIPPASFHFLVSTLATQTLAALGQLPDPVSGQPTVRKNLAQHHIDTLVMLQEKTTGNLTHDEEQLLDDAIHQLRMIFVSVGQQ